MLIFEVDINNTRVISGINTIKIWDVNYNKIDV